MTYYPILLTVSISLADSLELPLRGDILAVRVIDFSYYFEILVNGGLVAKASLPFVTI